MGRPGILSKYNYNYIIAVAFNLPAQLVIAYTYTITKSSSISEKFCLKITNLAPSFITRDNFSKAH